MVLEPYNASLEVLPKLLGSPLPLDPPPLSRPHDRKIQYWNSAFYSSLRRGETLFRHLHSPGGSTDVQNTSADDAAVVRIHTLLFVL